MDPIVVTPLAPADRPRWAALWRGYLDFYHTRLPEATYADTWERLTSPDGAIRGLGARAGGESAPLVGIAHYLFHPHAWSPREVCYLQDLFVDAAARRQGCGRALIAAVADEARARGSFRLYWTTKEDNAAARRLYDRIARFNGFIRYDYPLE